MSAQDRGSAKLSYILNTSALDPHVNRAEALHDQLPYENRAEVVRKEILPALSDFDEVIVAGVFEPGENYRYVEVEARSRSRANALVQREMGARHAIGDILVFGHDDHKPGEDFAEALRSFDEDFDLLVPERLSLEGETLPNGQDEELNSSQRHDYMGGHVCVLKRWLWARVPWTSVYTSYWDVPMTRLWQEAGAEIAYTDALSHVRLE